MNLYSRFVKQNVEHLMTISKLILFLMVICHNANASSEHEDSVKKVIYELNEATKNYDTQSLNSTTSNSLIEDKVSSYFDFDQMCAINLSQYWYKSTQSQKKNLLFNFANN